MTEIVRLAANAVAAKAIDASREVKLILSRLLSYEVEAAQFSPAFKSGHWDGRSSFFDYRPAVFPAGFVHLAAAELQKKGYQVQIIQKRLLEPLGPTNPIVDEFGNDNPRYDYQMMTVEALLKHGRGIARVATGGGKSKIAKLAIARINRPTLFLTTRSVLMYQMKDQLEAMGRRVGVLGDGEWSLARTNVAMVQTLAARIAETTYEQEVERILELQATREKTEREILGKRMDELKIVGAKRKAGLDELARRHEKARLPDAEIAQRAQKAAEDQKIARYKAIKLLEAFEFVIGEEAHEASGNSFHEILKHCRNAHYRLALTATPFMKADAESNMRLMAAFGPIIIEVSEKLLIERGILATPYFKYVDLDCPPKLFRTTGWQRAYKFGIVENDIRNRHIVFEAVRAARLGLPVMILVQHKAHGRRLDEMLSAAGLRSGFIFGESDQDTRKRTLKDLGAGRVQVLIGSTILDVGVDVPAVGMVILAGGGKAEVQLRQRIGRGLREKKSGPNVAFIVDFTDRFNQHTRDHASQRRQIIAETPGFGERLLSAGGDFPYAALGLTEKAA